MNKTFMPVIYDCNDNCISCPVPRRQNQENPTFESIKKEVDEVLKVSEHIELNGGEPTLRTDILKILRYIQKKNPKEIGLLTNAQIFYYEEYAKKIAKIKNLKIITTLYGPDPRIHDAITRTPGSFKHKIKGIRNLIKNNVRIELRILLHKMNYQHFDKIIDFLIHNFNNTDFAKIIVLNPKLTEKAEKNKKFVSKKLTVLSKFLEKPIKKLIQKGYNVDLYHFPHCILPQSLWSYSRGVTGEDAEIVFVENCQACVKDKKCSKIWKSYIDIFGYDEFKAIKTVQDKEVVNRVNNPSIGY